MAVCVGGVHTVQSPEGQHYMVAPYNYSYQCVSEEDIKLHEYDPHNATNMDQSSVTEVVLGLYKVHVQAGDLPNAPATFGPGQWPSWPAASHSQLHLCDTGIRSGCLGGKCNMVRDKTELK